MVQRSRIFPYGKKNRSCPTGVGCWQQNLCACLPVAGCRGGWMWVLHQPRVTWQVVGFEPRTLIQEVAESRVAYGAVGWGGWAVGGMGEGAVEWLAGAVGQLGRWVGWLGGWVGWGGRDRRREPGTKERKGARKRRTRVGRATWGRADQEESRHGPGQQQRAHVGVGDEGHAQHHHHLAHHREDLPIPELLLVPRHEEREHNVLNPLALHQDKNRMQAQPTAVGVSWASVGADMLDST